MPIYEFRCSSCGHQFERLQKASDPDPVCPRVTGEAQPDQDICGQDTKKVVSRSTFHLKGGGWASEGYH